MFNRLAQKTQFWDVAFLNTIDAVSSSKWKDGQSASKDSNSEYFSDCDVIEF